MKCIDRTGRAPHGLAVAVMLLLAGCGGGDSGTGGVASSSVSSAGSSSGSASSSSTSSGGGAATVPGAPVIGTVTAGDASATVSFTAPASNGGSAITGYTATCTAAGSLVKSGTASPITVTGLTNGTAYTCSVTATNAVGTGAASGGVAVTPSAAAGGTVSTAAVYCPYSGTYTGTYSSSGTLTATWNWACASGRRTLTGNGLPNHVVGTFPNAGNPNTITVQNVSASITLTPTKGATNTPIGGPGGAAVYALNSVKFDPGTAGTCPGTMTRTLDCNLANGTDVWRIEALGQSSFNFGVDQNNAHVQPGGVYHYHGMPEGLLINAGVSDTNRKMVLVGWAGDGYPVYARYCYSSAMDATSALKPCATSYAVDTVADAGRPSTTLVPLGAFQSDWNYVAGSGDLDDCNGRTGVTPEFPNGIYYYMATDTYPFFSRCIKGPTN